jgi:hypothetical protein
MKRIWENICYHNYNELRNINLLPIMVRKNEKESLKVVTININIMENSFETIKGKEKIKRVIKFC